MNTSLQRYYYITQPKHEIYAFQFLLRTVIVQQITTIEQINKTNKEKEKERTKREIIHEQKV